MKGSWELTKEEREKYIPYIAECIKRLDSVDEIDLVDTTLNPENMRSIMEELGYTEINFDSNGWEYDFWINFAKEGEKNVTVSGCGMTFDLKLLGYDD